MCCQAICFVFFGILFRNFRVILIDLIFDVLLNFLVYPGSNGSILSSLENCDKQSWPNPLSIITGKQICNSHSYFSFSLCSPVFLTFLYYFHSSIFLWLLLFCVTISLNIMSGLKPLKFLFLCQEHAVQSVRVIYTNLFLCYMFSFIFFLRFAVQI